jgi:hypothetical protein
LEKCKGCASNSPHASDHSCERRKTCDTCRFFQASANLVEGECRIERPKVGKHPFAVMKAYEWCAEYFRRDSSPHSHGRELLGYGSNFKPRSEARNG